MSNDKTPEQPSTHWRDKVKGTRQAYNENNDQSKGKNLHDIKPAPTTTPGENKQAPTVEQKTPTAKVEQQPKKFAERIKQKTPPPTPPKGPSGPRK